MRGLGTATPTSRIYRLTSGKGHTSCRSGVANSILTHNEIRHCRTHNIALWGFTTENIDDYCRMLTEALIKMN